LEGFKVDLLSQDSLRQVLSDFGLPELADWRLLRRSAVKRDEMARVGFGEHPAVLIRFHDPQYYRHSDIEQQTRFRSYLYSTGIPVARLYHTSDGALYRDLRLSGEDWPVTVEQWVDGESPQTVTLALVALMGQTLSRMHAAAPGSRVWFGHGTRMSLLVDGEQYAANAGMLRDVFCEFGLGHDAQSLLFDPWEVARERLRSLWHDLPRGPVHADFAEYNLLLDETENIAAVIDFNRAGDDVFVNELAHACLRLPSSGQDEHDRVNLSRFVAAYEEVRPLSDRERLSIPYLITAIRPFRWREVSPLLKAADKPNADALRQGLARLVRLADPSTLMG
jgi:Ser/Thr protein kinase RdoA (MazF antagonist)